LIGAYFGTTKNPYLLRCTLLQLLNQTIKPNLIVIHDNNSKVKNEWVIEDIVKDQRNKDVEIVYLHTEAPEKFQEWVRIPLNYLVERKCKYFFKVDHDDIYFNNHIESILPHLRIGYDLVVQTHAGFLTLKPKQEPEYVKDYNFSLISPLKGLSSGYAHSLNFAKELNKDMLESSYTYEDVIVGNITIPKFPKIRKIQLENPTACYVCYGGNVSTSEWACKEWTRENIDRLVEEFKKELK
jgi:hypothetical protein